MATDEKVKKHYQSCVRILAEVKLERQQAHSGDYSKKAKKVEEIEKCLKFFDGLFTAYEKYKNQQRLL
jgi:hypothetical protein